MRRHERLHRLPSFDRLGQSDLPSAIVEADWPVWLRAVERRRRSLLRQTPTHGFRSFPAIYFAHATFITFRLESIDLLRQHVTDALVHTAASRSMRSRLAQRIRNHVSILRHLEHSIHLGEPLTLAGVLRWYTSIGCGLCATGLNDVTMARLDQVVRQVNSPHLRLQPAVQEIVQLHTHLMLDPLVPSFNGILVRLLLRYHLGRCNLPPVFFDPEMDPAVLRDSAQLLPRLLQLIEESYRFLTESE